MIRAPLVLSLILASTAAARRKPPPKRAAPQVAHPAPGVRAPPPVAKPAAPAPVSTPVIHREASWAHTYDRTRRVAYLEFALASIEKASPASLEDAHQYAAAMDRGACATSAQRLRVECLLTAARKFCKGKGTDCLDTLDIVVANVLAEPELVPDERRYELMKTAADYRTEIAREVRRVQGSLAVDFHLRMAELPEGSLPEKIDAFCSATADKSNLPWQTCAASLVWFIGTSA